MSLTSWILDRFGRKHRTRRDQRPAENELMLYVRRLEDRRVLSVTAVDDAYFVDAGASSQFTPPQLGVLSNDDNTDPMGGLQAVAGTFSTDQGGTVQLNPDGSFDYFAPFLPSPTFVDSFTYTVTDTPGGMFTSVGNVSLFVGEIPIQFDTPTIVPVFGVESPNPMDTVNIDLTVFPTDTLTLLDTTNITFNAGSTNGSNSLSFSGTVKDVNDALDSLQYTPEPGYSGEADITLMSSVMGGGGPINNTQVVDLFVEPPGGPGPRAGVTAQDDAYFIDETVSSTFISAQLGVLSNDSPSGVIAVDGIFSTDQGGTVSLNMDGSFDYVSPFAPGTFFVDIFTYQSADPDFIEISTPATVTLFVGEIPIPFDTPTSVAVFGVESGNPSVDFVTVELTVFPTEILTLTDTTGVTFNAGSSNGSNFLSFDGTVQDVNAVLDTLIFTPEMGYSGPADIAFTSTVSGGPVASFTVPLFVQPPPGPPPPPPPPPGGNIDTVDDIYYFDGTSTTNSVTAQLGVLSNDENTAMTGLQAVAGSFTTGQGGTVVLNADGSFDYFSPFPASTVFFDTFVYTASNGSSTEFSSSTLVSLFVGEIPIPFNTPTAVPVFGVETANPTMDIVTVELTVFPTDTLTLLDTSDITFNSGSTNGSNFLSISGVAEDINEALDSLIFTPEPGYTGPADIAFTSMGPSGNNSFTVLLFVEPPPGGFGNIFAADDSYYIDPNAPSTFVSVNGGLLSNDFHASGDTLFAMDGTFSTDFGGTVSIAQDGSFNYTPPTFGPPQFVDSFFYSVTDETETVDGFVTLFVGDIRGEEDFPIFFPFLYVDVLSPTDFVSVQVASQLGASLNLFNPGSISFDVGANGDSSFIISGTVKDINLALDFLDYSPPEDFSGDDDVTLTYQIPAAGGGTQTVVQVIPVKIAPIADAPSLEIESLDPVGYLPKTFVEIDIEVELEDTDGSEFLGFIALVDLPPGVLPNVGEPAPFDPNVFLIKPEELANLKLFFEVEAPESFTIQIFASSIERTDQPGQFGGPGGPLFPNGPTQRFATSGATLSFKRLPPPVEPPPPPEEPPPMPPMMEAIDDTPEQQEAVFFVGPQTSFSSSTAPPPPGEKNTVKKLNRKGDKGDKAPPDAGPPPGAIVESGHSSGTQESGNSPVAAAEGPSALNNDVVANEEQNNEQSRRSYETSGIYVRKVGSDQFARLPEDLSEDYARFMKFLKTLPNGDYIVYFKRSGQSHEQASMRQAVVKVRVVNNRLNPDSSDFKPAGEVAEPPQDPNAPSVPVTTELPESNERARLEIRDSNNQPLATAAVMGILARWTFRKTGMRNSVEIDRRMEHFTHRKFRRRTTRK